MDQVYITSLLDDFKNHSFVLFRVAKNFCSHASFKESLFSLSPILEGGARTAMDFENLFGVEGKLGSDIQNKIDFLKSCEQMSWPNVPSKNDKKFEDEVMVDLAQKALEQPDVWVHNQLYTLNDDDRETIRNPHG